MPAAHASETPISPTDGNTVLSELRVLVCTVASKFDARLLDRDAAALALMEWSTIAHAAETGLALAAARIDDCGAPPSAGASSAADYVAKKIGSTSTKAKEKINSGRGMGSSTAVRRRAAAGALSPEQTAAITDALSVNPSAEDRLLSVAETSSLGGLRDECANSKTEGQDLAAIEQRIHSQRCLRRYRDKEGAEHLHAVGTKATMARIDQAIRSTVDEIFKEARAGGIHEPLDAYAYDALVTLADRSVEPRADRSERRRVPTIRNLAILRLDLEALRRGTPAAGETCEIAGLGPISVETARAMLGESIVKLVITNGVDVQNVTHLGRGPNIAQKIALLWQHPGCIREGCNRTARVEYNHAYGAEYRTTKHTRLDETEPLCDPDHDLQTYHGWSLIKGTGKRPMVPPDDPRHPKNRPPP